MTLRSSPLPSPSRGTAADDGKAVLSHGELRRRAESVAGRLRALQLGPGDVVGLRGGMTHELLAALHGCWLAGVEVAPMNLRWTVQEDDVALRALEPSVLLLTDEQEDRDWAPPDAFSGTVFSLDPVGRHGGPEPLQTVAPSPGRLPALPPSAAAARILTSGTSGKPACIVLSHENLRASAMAAAQRLGLAPSDSWLASLSPAHVGGLALLARAAFLGSCLVLRRRFDVDDFIDLAGRGLITHASLVPTMLHQVLEGMGGAGAPEGLKCVLIGGAKAHESMLDRALAASFPVALTYGLTEATSQVATAPPSLVRRKPGTVGSPLQGVEVNLAEDGEILVRGSTVASGAARPDGWLSTGDLARIDGEGHLWITGRVSHRIISGGVNVDPEEVEAVLLSHPGVEEVAVVGLPDPEWGERVVAAVVLSPGARLTDEDLVRFARPTLSSSKRPRLIRVVENLPRNPNGKVDPSKVRALFR